MNIYEYTPGNVALSQNAVIALGFFDGVHKGHRYLLKKAKELAKREGLLFAVFTFRSESHNLKTGSPIYSTEDKLYLFEQLGVEAVILADFNAVSHISAEDFIMRSLLLDMNCKIAVCGQDFRFGSNANGDAALLEKTLKEAGLVTLVVDEQTEDGEKISTTKIKGLIADGNIKKAGSLLGVPYFITGKVRHGLGLGKKLGFPTVNTELSGSLNIKQGVYSAAVFAHGKFYTGITNVGVCPTFEKRELHAETYILNYTGDLYDDTIRIFLLDYLREEKRFESAEALTMQITLDKEKAIKENGDIKWQEIGLN